MTAINDALMLEGAIYHLLCAHFRGEPFYVGVLELLHETTYRTEMGQLVDLLGGGTCQGPQGRADLGRFSMENYRLMVLYKTAYYSFYLPVALAMLVRGVPEVHNLDVSGTSMRPYDVAREILLPLGEYFQVQDDFLDFAGTPEQIGKIGTDIVEGKSSWVINTALKVASPEQQQVLEENYGQKNTEREQRVKDMFEELNIRELYDQHEQRVVGDINAKIDAVVEVDGGLKREVFRRFLRKIYKRDK